MQLIGRFLIEIGVTKVLWLLDSPVSNSGRLKSLIGGLVQKNNWNWEIQLLASPDGKLSKTDMIVVSSDSVVLDRCKHWANLAGAIIEQKLSDAYIVDLS